jgi:radical SAM superfamily enzyme YgiQ (UPF0313 family)
MSVATTVKHMRPHVNLRLLDCRAEELDRAGLENVIREFEPDLVGITCLTFFYLDALSAAAAVKRVRPQAKVCLGGFHPTLYPQETLAQPEVDFVAFGEGEFTMVDLVDALEAGNNDFRNIPGLGFKGSNGLILNDQRALTEKLDDIIHPEYTLLDYSKYGHILGHGETTLALESSRGCPFSCSFCDIRRTKFRYRSPTAVVDVIEKWYRKGVHSFFFIDDNLTVIKERANEICRLIVDRGLKIDFKVSSRVDTVNEEVLGNLKRAGCSRLSLGIESSKQKNLDFLGKGVTEEQISGTLKAAHKVGLPVFAYMIIGFPGQTRREMFDEVDFLKRHWVSYANFSILTIYPKTLLYQQALENGWIDHDPWPEFSRNPTPNIAAPRINRLYSREQLEEIQHAMIRRFYVSPRSILRQLSEINSWEGFVSRARIGLRLLRRG